MTFKIKTLKVKEPRFTIREKKNFDFKIRQLKEETLTGRHILASLGSVGLTFVSDIDRFNEYLVSKKEFTLLNIIRNNRSLTDYEMGRIKKEWK